ncbi:MULTISPECIES: CHAT domain-containing protein [unclassified Coleofasciculus]|uniref:CHAT domain-containing protein n=1 Tax=Coleofasciculus sp. LEGE 07081 TaxID=2777967 RepID=UPI001D1533CB|nr:MULTISPECIES: CHAT domain-containing protein [unclassified Coleofasciculus]
MFKIPTRKIKPKLQQSPDKAQALRQAMLTTMKQHPNPRDWAAFTLIGEDDCLLNWIENQNI